MTTPNRAQAPNRGWRFDYPGIDAPEDRAGLRISVTGRVEMAGAPQSIRQAVLLLLTTRRGERVMRPGYGCDLHKLIFSPNDETTAGLAIHYVRDALETWEPRIDILRLDAGASREAPERLEITLEYRVRVTRRVESLVFPLNLGGA
jgi:phage baseplate assembly protein W